VRRRIEVLGSHAACQRRATPAGALFRARTTLAAARAALPVALGATLAATPAPAQTSASDPTDVQAWGGAVLELDLPKGWEASLQYRLRMVDDASSYRGSYLTAEAGYGLTDWLDALGGYRLARVEGGTYHRFALGAEATLDPSDALRFTLRPLLQHQQRTFADDDEQSGDEKTLLRTRLRARHEPTDRLDLYASTEPYFAFGADYPVDNWRNTFGVKYDLTEAVALDLFYIYRPDYAREYNRTFHVIGFELEIARSLP
jgi:hypothetical protein